MPLGDPYGPFGIDARQCNLFLRLLGSVALHSEERNKGIAVASAKQAFACISIMCFAVVACQTSIDNLYVQMPHIGCTRVTRADVRSCQGMHAYQVPKVACSGTVATQHAVLDVICAVVITTCGMALGR